MELSPIWQPLCQLFVFFKISNNCKHTFSKYSLKKKSSKGSLTNGGGIHIYKLLVLTLVRKVNNKLLDLLSFLLILENLSFIAQDKIYQKGLGINNTSNGIIYEVTRITIHPNYNKQRIYENNIDPLQLKISSQMSKKCEFYLSFQIKD